MFATNPGRVLIVDDEINTLKASATILRMSGLQDVVTEPDSRRVLEIMSAGGFDVVGAFIGYRWAPGRRCPWPSQTGCHWIP